MNSMNESLIGFSLAIATFLILFSTVTFGGEVYRTQDIKGTVVRLLNEPCTLFPLKKWKEAVMIYKGKTYKACWVNDSAEVSILDEEEEISYVPVQAFTKEDPI